MRESGRPWRELLSDVRFAVPSWQRHWFTNPQTGVIFQLMSSSRRERFLEIGHGAGMVSTCLSADYAQGYVLTDHQLWGQFMSERFRADSVQNVEVLRGSPLAIPLPAKSVDLVALNGALESAPEASLSLDPREAQIRMLRDVHRCLRPRGRVVVAARNAWARSRSVRPATLERRSDRVTDPDVTRRHATGPVARPRRELLHSYIGYRRLLHETGFENIRGYVVAPDYYTPIDLYSFDKVGLDSLFARRHASSSLRSMAKRLSDALRMTYPGGYFESSFYLVGTK